MFVMPVVGSLEAIANAVSESTSSSPKAMCTGKMRRNVVASKAVAMLASENVPVSVWIGRAIVAGAAGQSESPGPFASHESLLSG